MAQDRVTACHGPPTSLAEAIHLAKALFDCRSAPETKAEGDAGDVAVGNASGDGAVDESAEVGACTVQLPCGIAFGFEGRAKVVDRFVHRED